MTFEVGLKKLALSTSLGLAAVAAPSLYAQSLIEVPHLVEHSVDHGSVQPLEEAGVTVHLKLHNQAGFDKAVADLYDPVSPTYHHWMTKSDFAKYAPSDAEVNAVKKELQSHGLTIVSVHENNFSIRARGTAVNLERAFQTQLHQVEFKGESIRANVTPAKLTGTAGDLVDSVTGLTNFHLKPLFKRQIDLQTGKPKPGLLAKKGKDVILPSAYYTNDCFGASASEYLTTAGASLPVGLYTGNTYVPGTTKACSWTPTQLQGHYGLWAAYNAGIAGQGETIVVIDAPTNSDFSTDLANFSVITGLPAITPSNYQVIYPDGEPTQFAKQVWDATGETQLDIEYAHAIAPLAKVDLLITPSQDWDEFEYAIEYAVTNKLGNVISISYGLPEALYGFHTIQGFEQSIKFAAAAGVAVNISSGDSGDAGTGTPNGGGASYPGGSAYATSIGGTSIGIPGPVGSEIGWGNNATILSNAQNAILDPPYALGFQGGSGGGESRVIAKPVWQSRLPGTGRQQPDISAVADPYTGAVILVGQYYNAVGGTSLAAPIFSAIWTLADQKAGVSLGQAAPLLTRIPGAILDVVPFTSTTDVSGVIVDSVGTFYYSPGSLVPPLYTTANFYSTLWDDSGNGSGSFVDLTFGTDSSLTVTPGWDNVTGYGVPKGYAFIESAAALK